MKIVSSPLAALKTQAEQEVNERFNTVATVDQWKSLAHSIKRAAAQAVIDGAEPTAEFTQAAALEGVTPAELATLIVNKTDEVMQTENRRRQLILAVRSAKSGADLTEIKSQLP